MRVASIQPLTGPLAAPTRVKAPSLDVEQPAPMPPKMTAAPTATTIEMLVAMAADTDPRAEREKMTRKGTQALDLLDRLNGKLMTGGNPADELDALSHWLETAGDMPDPQIRHLMDEIELRIRVELAKQQRFG